LCTSLDGQAAPAKPADPSQHQQPKAWPLADVCLSRDYEQENNGGAARAIANPSRRFRRHSLRQNAEASKRSNSRSREKKD